VNKFFSMVFDNPEVKRNFRTQLRSNRMISTAAICGVISLIIVPSLTSNMWRTSSQTESAEMYLRAMLFLQAAVLLFGGCGACLNAISREKEMNTFDYQRITQMTPLELSLGKLFGAPAWSWFAALCFLPAVLMGAFSSQTSLVDLFAAFTLIVFGSVLFHSLALLLSLVVDRSAGGLKWLFLLILATYGLLPGGLIFQVGPLNPLGASLMVGKTRAIAVPGDAFFGIPIPHPIVMVVLSVLFSGWFLLALSRNIKRDPAVYELFEPLQALGLALFVTFLQVGFFRWGVLDPDKSQLALLSLNVILFYVLGLVLLRSRDRARRRLREAKASEPGWMDSLWPSPYILAGMLPAGLVVISLIEVTRKHPLPLDGALAMFRLLLLAFWVVRDILYLQWMYIRSSGNSLRKAFLYLFVFNVAMSTTMFVGHPGAIAERAIFTPWLALAIDAATWNTSGGVLLTALLAQIGACAVFAYLQYLELGVLAAPRRSVPQPGPRPAQTLAG
jgi:hypothetical protein